MPAPASLLEQLRENVPFYRHHWRAAGVEVRGLRWPEDLARLPVVTKADLLRCEVAARLDARFAHGKLTAETTSGSTGQPLELRIDKAHARRRRWRFLRALVACGYRPGDQLMLISSRPSGAIRRVSTWATLARWKYVDLYAGENELLQEYLRTQPRVLYGPLSALLMLAQAIDRDGPANYHRPAIVVSTAEQLTDSSRRSLREAFGVDVTDFYGMAELGLVAWCKSGEQHYFTAQHGLALEFLPTADLAGFERLVVTDPDGPMPLIRYDTGDLVRRDRTRADSPIVEIGGRQVDFIRLPDGRRVSPYRIDGALSELPGLRRYQVLQQPDLSIDLSVGTAGNDSAPTLELAREALLRVLYDVQVNLRVHHLPTAHLPLTHKLRPIQSRAGMST